MGKIKLFVIPCLLLSLCFGILAVPKTLALFTDSMQYSFVIYPYDGRNAQTCTFNDNSTIKAFEDGDVAIISYSFTNPSIATVDEVDIVVTMPNGTQHTSTLQTIASGQTASATIAVPITAAMLTPVTESGYENKYRTITVNATLDTILDAYEDTVTVNKNIGSSTLFIYEGGA